MFCPSPPTCLVLSFGCFVFLCVFLLPSVLLLALSVSLSLFLPVLVLAIFSPFGAFSLGICVYTMCACFSFSWTANVFLSLFPSLFLLLFLFHRFVRACVRAFVRSRLPFSSSRFLFCCAAGWLGRRTGCVCFPLNPWRKTVPTKKKQQQTCLNGRKHAFYTLVPISGT